MTAHETFRQAAACYQAGKLQQAEDFCREILAEVPDHFDALHLLGVLRAHMGDDEEAVRLIGEAVKIKPSSVRAQVNLGSLQAKIGRKNEALLTFDAVVALRPNNAEILFARANLLRDAGRLADAADGFEQVVALEPSSVEALINLASVLLELRRHEDALNACGRVLAQQPDHPAALYSRATALRGLGRLEEALNDLNRTIVLKADFADAYQMRGAILSGLNRHAAALADFDKGAALKAGFADAFITRADALIEAGRLQEVLANADLLLAMEPQNAAAHNSRGVALERLDQLGEAKMCFDRAIALNPDYPEAHSNRALVLRRLGLFKQALESLDRAIALDPDFALNLYYRSMVLSDLDRLVEAYADSERASALMPKDGVAACARFHFARQLCDWSGHQAKVDDLKRRCRENQKLELRGLLQAFDDPELHLRVARCAAGPVRKSINSGAHAAHSRLRIAYLSADFGDHPVAYQTVEMFECHDKARFETYGISLMRAENSEIRQRLKNAFDHFVEVDEPSDEELARRIAELEIDIAVDLGGHTKNSRTKCLSFRPAPIAVTYLGYPGTTGADYIDYIVADAKVIPPECEEFYTERIARLPDCFMPADTRNRTVARLSSRKDVGLPENGFVFCAFNNSFKLDPEMFNVWMRLLRAVEGSVLWLNVQNATAQNNLRAEAEARKVSPERLIFAGRTQGREENFARLALANLYLDTHPYSAHATASDFLWAGVPILTISGRSFASRVAASMLTAIGAEELITHELGAYEAMALKLARTPEFLATVRAKLASNRATSALFDTVRLCRHLEVAYQTMWDCHLKGRKPESFMVNSLVERGD